MMISSVVAVGRERERERERERDFSNLKELLVFELYTGTDPLQITCTHTRNNFHVISE